MTADRPRRYRYEWILLGAVLLILGALIGDWLYAEHDQIESLERDRLQGQARVIDENLARQLEGVNAALVWIRNDFPPWRRGDLGPAVSHQLKALSNAMPGVRTLLIVDAGGDVLAASRDELIGSNFSGREYFKAPRQRPEPDMLYVSAPFKTVFDVVVIAVTRAVVGPKGEFGGVVTATLDPEYFNVLLRSVLYAPDMRAVLVHGDGQAFVSMPPLMAGFDLARPGSFFRQHLEGGKSATLITSTSGITGLQRMMASRTFKNAGAPMDKPLVIQVSRELSAIYAPWRRQALTYGVLYGVSGAAAILGLYFLQRRRRIFDRLALVHEKERRDSAERLELALGGADLGLWDWHVPSGKVIFDERWCTMLGYGIDEIQPHVGSWQEMVHPDDWPVIHAALDPHLQGSSTAYESEHRMRHKDGRWIWILDRGKVMERDAAGAPVRVVGTHMNITERRRREDEYRIIIQASTDGFWITDIAGRILDANESICRMLGYSREALVRMNIADIETDIADADLVTRRHEIMRTGGALLQTRHLRKDGTAIDVELSILYVAELGERFYAFIRDVTERKQAEARQNQLEAQLRESQKMEALGTLAGGVAHDFNNIVATIMGNAELALEDVEPRHAARQSLEEIRKASRRAKNLVQQILAFGRRQVLEREVISLAPAVEESARLLRATLPAGVSLSIECAPDAPEVLADATQVQQVLLNLCTNAWQAMQGQEQPAAIAVSLTPHLASDAPYSGPERRTRVGRVALRPGLYACLTVRDTGPGMDGATRSRIFEPFFTTKPVGKGTGLGLAVVHGIIEDHGASIAVHSTPGGGATFRVYFPATEQVAGPMQGAQPKVRTAGEQGGRSAVPQGQGKSILYVDDDEAIVLLMTRLLERQGYRVSGYADPRDALAAVQAQPDAFDLAVTDFNMPGMSGLEVARALREIRGDLPVALASGYITEELRAEAPAAGVSELIYKPNSVEELCEIIARLANAKPEMKDGRAYMPKGAAAC